MSKLSDWMSGGTIEQISEVQNRSKDKWREAITHK